MKLHSSNAILAVLMTLLMIIIIIDADRARNVD